MFKPTKEFHTVRHTLYSAEENMEIDKVVPVAASVKTKNGRSGAGEEKDENPTTLHPPDSR